MADPPEEPLEQVVTRQLPDVTETGPSPPFSPGNRRWQGLMRELWNQNMSKNDVYPFSWQKYEHPFRPDNVVLDFAGIDEGGSMPEIPSGIGSGNYTVLAFDTRGPQMFYFHMSSLINETKQNWTDAGINARLTTLTDIAEDTPMWANVYVRMAWFFDEKRLRMEFVTGSSVSDLRDELDDWEEEYGLVVNATWPEHYEYLHHLEQAEVEVDGDFEGLKCYIYPNGGSSPFPARYDEFVKRYGTSMGGTYPFVRGNAIRQKDFQAHSEAGKKGKWSMTWKRVGVGYPTLGEIDPPPRPIGDDIFYELEGPPIIQGSGNFPGGYKQSWRIDSSNLHNFHIAAWMEPDGDLNVQIRIHLLFFGSYYSVDGVVATYRIAGWKWGGASVDGDGNFDLDDVTVPLHAVEYKDSYWEGAYEVPEELVWSVDDDSGALPDLYDENKLHSPRWWDAFQKYNFDYFADDDPTPYLFPMWLDVRHDEGIEVGDGEEEEEEEPEDENFPYAFEGAGTGTWMIHLTITDATSLSQHQPCMLTGSRRYWNGDPNQRMYHRVLTAKNYATLTMHRKINDLSYEAWTFRLNLYVVTRCWEEEEWDEETGRYPNNPEIRCVICDAEYDPFSFEAPVEPTYSEDDVNAIFGQDELPDEDDPTEQDWWEGEVYNVEFQHGTSEPRDVYMYFLHQSEWIRIDRYDPFYPQDELYVSRLAGTYDDEIDADWWITFPDWEFDFEFIDVDLTYQGNWDHEYWGRVIVFDSGFLTYEPNSLWSDGDMDGVISMENTLTFLEGDDPSIQTGNVLSDKTAVCASGGEVSITFRPPPDGPEAPE